MRGRSLAEILVGAAVLCVAAGFLIYAVVNSGRASVGSGYLLTARFDSIDGLASGADVRMAGVKVGSVTDARIDPQSYLAVVTLRVSDAIKLPRDSSARILSEGLMGGNFIALEPGGDEAMLAPGQAIPNTQSSVNLVDLIGRFIFSGATSSSSSSPSPEGGAPQEGAGGAAPR